MFREFKRHTNHGIANAAYTQLLGNGRWVKYVPERWIKRAVTCVRPFSF